MEELRGIPKNRGVDLKDVDRQRYGYLSQRFCNFSKKLPREHMVDGQYENVISYNY